MQLSRVAIIYFFFINALCLAYARETKLSVRQRLSVHYVYLIVSYVDLCQVDSLQLSLELTWSALEAVNYQRDELMSLLDNERQLNRQLRLQVVNKVCGYCNLLV